MASEKQAKIRIFCSYSDKDRFLQERLENHLSSLEREGSVLTWNKHKIKAGQEHQREIDNQLKRADLILLLISSNFISSDDCYARDLAMALQRHEKDRIRVIPILLKPCTWDGLEFSAFQVLPRNGIAVTQWANRDAAFTHIVEEIKTVVQELHLFRSGYMEPLRPNPLHKARIENSQVTSTRQRTTNATQRTQTTQRRERTPINQQSNTLAEEGIIPVKARRLKALPKAHSISIGDAIQEFLLFFVGNLSGHAFKKRCYRWKGKSAFLLVVFVLLDLGLLPFAVYQQSHSVILTVALEAFSLFLFSLGVSNEENAVGVIMALAYIVIWVGIDLWYLSNHPSLSSSQLSILSVILAATIFRLLLFLWRTPFGQR
ncbi:MAG: toll/interleukin-1 receptor domain-containing protein [Ktedonobacteraceae bacterium]